MTVPADAETAGESGRRLEPAADAVPDGQVVLDELLRAVVDLGGSDLHLTAGSPPAARIDGDLTIMDEYPRLIPDAIASVIQGMLSERQRDRLNETKELDGSHPVAGLGRFRFNVFQQRGSLGAVFRTITSEIPDLADLGMPPVVKELAQLPRGLVLVTGPTGSGKSTTLAALTDLINRTRRVHIMTIEDPIETTHRHNLALVNQREVGQDTRSFAAALKQVLRQDPDVILIGEMRDIETISTAITAAETGHLVFGTLHTNDAAQTVDRMIDVFPAHQQQQVRVQVAVSLQAVVSQQLLPRASGPGRVVAVEIMLATAAVRNLIREGKTHQIPSAIQSGAKYGMQSMDQSLAKLVTAGRVEYSVAADRAHDPAQLDAMVGRA